MIIIHDHWGTYCFDARILGEVCPYLKNIKEDDNLQRQFQYYQGQVVKLFLNWVLYGSIALYAFFEQHAEERYAIDLIDAWRLGHAFEIEEFQNAVIDTFIHYRATLDCSTGESLRLAYNGSEDGDPLRVLAIDMFISLNSPQDMMDECSDIYHEEAAADALKALCQKILGQRVISFEGNICAKYHVHNITARCESEGMNKLQDPSERQNLRKRGASDQPPTTSNTKTQRTH